MFKFSIPVYILTGLAAIAMASVAAFFSITGLAALYAGAAGAVIMMGSTIEFSKIISTIWLHKFWKQGNYVVVGLLTAMVLASMAVTSGGVYGFLTGSHASQEAPASQNQLIIDRYDQEITVEKDKIARDQKRIESLDNIVSTSLIQKNGGSGADRINRRQGSERSTIQAEIDDSYKHIDTLSASKLTSSQQQVQSEAKLGAVKYIAALFGADPSKAVMYFTVVMVMLLDPFAITLVIATQIAYEKRDVPFIPEKTEPEIENDVTYEPEPEIENDVTCEPEPEPVQNTKLFDFFNDSEIQNTMSTADEETIDKIGEVVNTENINDDEKVEQVLRALGGAVSPAQIEEARNRWLGNN